LTNYTKNYVTLNKHFSFPLDVIRRYYNDYTVSYFFSFLLATTENLKLNLNSYLATCLTIKTLAKRNEKWSCYECFSRAIALTYLYYAGATDTRHAIWRPARSAWPRTSVRESARSTSELRASNQVTESLFRRLTLPQTEQWLYNLWIGGTTMQYTDYNNYITSLKERA